MKNFKYYYALIIKMARVVNAPSGKIIEDIIMDTEAGYALSLNLTQEIVDRLTDFRNYREERDYENMFRMRRKP